MEVNQVQVVMHRHFPLNAQKLEQNENILLLFLFCVYLLIDSWQNCIQSMHKNCSIKRTKSVF